MGRHTENELQRPGTVFRLFGKVRILGQGWAMEEKGLVG